jgi:hypothetical protein
VKAVAVEFLGFSCSVGGSRLPGLSVGSLQASEGERQTRILLVSRDLPGVS